MIRYGVVIWEVPMTDSFISTTPETHMYSTIVIVVVIMCIIRTAVELLCGTAITTAYKWQRSATPLFDHLSIELVIVPPGEEITLTPAQQQFLADSYRELLSLQLISLIETVSLRVEITFCGVTVREFGTEYTLRAQLYATLRGEHTAPVDGTVPPYRIILVNF